MFQKKYLKKPDNASFSNNDIDLDYIDSDVGTFVSDDMDLDNIDLNNIKLDDDSFEDDPETIIHVRRMAQYHKFKQFKACKKELYVQEL